MLNQMFSTAVLHQAEAIESIYEAAVDASQVIGCEFELCAFLFKGANMHLPTLSPCACFHSADH